VVASKKSQPETDTVLKGIFWTLREVLEGDKAKQKMKNLLLFFILAFLSMNCDNQTTSTVFSENWDNISTRHWLGEHLWANRLQDWQVKDGRIECLNASPKLKMRTVHLLSHRLGGQEGAFEMSAETGALTTIQSDAATGFLIGAGKELNVLGASLVMQNTGKGAGLFLGINGEGQLFLKDMETDSIWQQADSQTPFPATIALSLTSEIDQLILKTETQELIINTIPSDRLVGNVALVSHPGNSKNPSTRFWFDEWKVSGEKFVAQGNASFGPIISAQHTLSNGLLKMTAQFPPIGKEDLHEVHFEIKSGGKWERLATAEIEEPSYTAHFRLDNWQDGHDIPYRLIYTNENGDYKGIIRKDPKEKEQIVLAGLSCNHNVAKPGLDRPFIDFNFDFSGIWYPHADLVEHLEQQEPDLLFFSGDQIYEGASPTYEDKEQPYLDYLYKWYLWCIAFRDLTKDIPVIAIPDDHDVFQGNIWGADGRHTEKDDQGGYDMPADWVKMVEQTQTSHLPDPYDPTPIEQGIGVYYTNMNYGRIGWAILEDRKFKSGCADLLPFKTRNRADHINDPDFDISQADVKGLNLLGDRQLAFLNDFSSDWTGHDMKAVLSQTVFANMATHHGDNHFRLIADLDSNGWPQSGRNKALDAIRKGFAFMIAGDQHLPTLVHHGIDEWGDAGYSFVVPAIANFYQRAWFPEEEGKDRAKDDPTYLGKHIDGLGNKVSVHAVANPASFTGVEFNIEPLSLHAKMPGYGIIRFNKTDRTIKAECWPRYVEPNSATDKDQYEGWPKTISIQDNYARNAVAMLPEIKVEGAENPVFQVLNTNNEVIYTIRTGETTFQPKVFKEGSYMVRVGIPEENIWKEIKGISTKQEKGVVVSF